VFPGAGKTLAGLNLVTLRTKAHEEEHAVFLPGNGPLVEVLREALARDEHGRLKEQGQKDQKIRRCSEGEQLCAEHHALSGQ
jgi:hypothetical protein